MSRRTYLGCGWAATRLATFACASVLALAACSSNRGDDGSNKWSALPHTMGCAVVDTSSGQDPPQALQVENVSFRPDVGERLAISLTFVQSTPPNPVAVTWSDGQARFAPGSLIWAVNIKPHHVEHGFMPIDYSVDGDWHADVSSFDTSRPGILPSVTTRGRTITFILDLEGQETFLGRGVFKADVWIQGFVMPAALDVPVSFKTQNCIWDMPVKPSPDQQSDGSSHPWREIPRPSDPPPAWMPTPTHAPPPIPSSTPSTGVSGTDAQGFVNDRGPRCNHTNQAVAIARTAHSRVVICQTGVGRYYYKGLGLQNGLSIEIDDPVRYGRGFVVTNEGVRYSVSPDALVITRGSAVLSNEPTLEYWSR